MKLPARAAVAALILAASSQAAYHYVHYPSRTNFTPIFEKFNLAALPNNTVTFFVADQGNSYGGNETTGSILSQIKQAAAAWNSVGVSDLRVAFGGLEAYSDSPSASQKGNPQPAAATPGGDVLFIDTPGLLGLGAPTISTTAVNGPSGPFFPIVRGVVMISRDSSSDPWPSYSEAFFTTAVHEMGHALGLQHTWTGSAMSQRVIRDTSRARPLDADDIASLAALYGKANWQANYGSIQGRVTYANNGNPVSLASVVAVSPSGPAVSALTNPDGTYRIDGLPGNLNYNLYVHPLPPDAVATDETGLRRPVDQNNAPFNPTGPFQTIFFAGAAGTLDPAAAGQFNVAPGSTFTANFNVQPRAAASTYNVKTYSRIFTATRQYGNPKDSEGVTISGYPGFVDSTQNTGLVIVQADSPAVLPVPQSVTVLGGFATATLRNPAYPAVFPYSDKPGDFIAVYLIVPPGAGLGPRHMVFNFGNDIYVLPSAIDLVRQGPPAVTAVSQNGDGTVTVSGAGFGYDSRVFFDGLQASQGTYNPADGSLTVTPPPGPSGQSSAVTVYNSDGQNSTMLPGTTPAAYSYLSGGGPQILAITPNAIPAGASAMLDITTANMNLVDGQVTLGLGTGDAQVRRLWVVGPNHAVANVFVPANALTGTAEASLISGMQVATSPAAFQVQAARAGAPAIASIANAVDPTQAINPGSFVSIFGPNVAQSFAGVQISLNDTPIPIGFANSGQINFQVPANFPTGPATLRLISSGVAAPPIVLPVDAPAPVIGGIGTLASASLSATPGPGDVLTVTASGLDPGLVANRSGRFKVTIAGIEMTIQQVTPVGPGQYQVQIVITQSFGGSQVPLVVVADGIQSAPITVTIR